MSEAVPSRFSVVGAALQEAPYPADTQINGYRFELDVGRIEASDTWALAPVEVRPWLLMLWLMAWKERPAGSLPADDRIVAAKIAMPPAMFGVHREILMRGWVRCSDGRLYHPVVSERVLEMIARRDAATERKRNYRAAKKEGIVPRDTSGTDEGPTRDVRIGTGTGTGTGKTPLIDTTAVHAGPSREPDAKPPPSKPPRCPHQAIVDLYHAALPTGMRVVALNDTRKSHIAARWREIWEEDRFADTAAGLAYFRDFFAKVARSRFLTGKTTPAPGRSPFRLSLGWLMNPENHLKVLEGHYER